MPPEVDSRPFPASEEERAFALNMRGQDPKSESMSELFELMVSYLLIAAVAYGVARGLFWVVTSLLPEVGTGWRIGILGCGFFGTVLAINMSFDGVAGETRKRRFAVFAKRYAFPITLAAGLYLGSVVNEYRNLTSDTAVAEATMIAACLQTPGCLQNANEGNGGQDILWKLKPRD